jgi:hypothetical protein
MNDIFAKTTVISTLVGSPAWKVKGFSLGSYKFSPALLTMVGGFFTSGTLHVSYNGSLGSVAEYDTGSNTMFLGFTSASSLSRRALIVHEGTHAACDLAVAREMDVGVSESMAYIVQCQYARANSDDPDPESRLFSEDAAKDRVFELAWAIAGTLLADGTPTASAYSDLRAAVNRHPYYAGKVGDNAAYNG